MRMAFVIYDGMTALDFIGAYDPLTRLNTMDLLPDVAWHVCATTTTVRDIGGLRFVPDLVGEPLTGYDLVFVPGGFGTRALMDDADFIAWIRTAAEAPLLASVCTGSLLLGAAGLLKDVRATTHPSAYEDLRPFCREVVQERIVDEGRIITGRGVTSSIDLGLLPGREAGGQSHPAAHQGADGLPLWRRMTRMQRRMRASRRSGPASSAARLSNWKRQARGLGRTPTPGLRTTGARICFAGVIRASFPCPRRCLR